jgi:hypothetical protein
VRVLPDPSWVGSVLEYRPNSHLGISHGRGRRFKTCHAHQHKRPPRGGRFPSPPANRQHDHQECLETHLKSSAWEETGQASRPALREVERSERPGRARTERRSGLPAHTIATATATNANSLGYGSKRGASSLASASDSPGWRRPAPVVAANRRFAATAVAEGQRLTRPRRASRARPSKTGPRRPIAMRIA